MTQDPVAKVGLAIPPIRYRTLLTSARAPSRLDGRQYDRDERKPEAMSVSFFELAQSGISGRATRPAGTRRAGTPRDCARPWQRYLGWALTGTGAAMIPWLFVLAGELPAQATAVHWNPV